VRRRRRKETAIEWSVGLVCAGPVLARENGIESPQPEPGRERHRYGGGPFAALEMPSVPDSPGIYVWSVKGVPVYVGKASNSLHTRLGANGYARISRYNTYAPQPGRKNGGQQTNCRINALAGAALGSGEPIELWYRTLPTSVEASEAESGWVRNYGVPAWSLRDER
jgi:hypothetical protein